MNIPRLTTAISFIDDDLLTEAITYSPTRGELFKTFCVRVSLVACACLAIAVLLWATGPAPSDGSVLSYPIDATPRQTEELQSNISDIVDVQINEIDTSYFVSQGMFDPGEESFEEMNRDEILDYFGVSIDLSEIMPNMHEDEDTRYGLYHFGDGSILNQFAFNYIDDETHQTMSIILRNKGMPITMINEAYEHELQKTMLYDKEVMIAHYTDFAGISTYYAEFSNGDLGVMITAGGCPIEDFIRTLEYLTES